MPVSDEAGVEALPGWLSPNLQVVVGGDSTGRSVGAVVKRGKPGLVNAERGPTVPATDTPTSDQHERTGIGRRRGPQAAHPDPDPATV